MHFGDMLQPVSHGLCVRAELRRLLRLMHALEALQAHALRGGHAQALGHGPIGPHNPVLVVQNGDQVRHAVEGALPLLFGAAQGLLGAPFFGHLVEHEHRSRHAAGNAHDRRGAVLNGQFAPVLGDKHGVIGQGDDASLRQHARYQIFRGLAGALVDDAEHALDGLAQRLLGTPTGEKLRDGIEKGDVAVGAGGYHRVADAPERDAQPLALLQQLLRGLLALDGVTNGPRNLPPVGLPLDQVVLHTLLDRRQANALVVGAGQHHDRQPGRRVVGAPIRFRSGAVGQRQVQQEHVEGLLDQARQGVLQPLHPGEFKAARAGLGQGLPQEVGVGRAVLHQQDADEVGVHGAMPPPVLRITPPEAASPP